MEQIKLHVCAPYKEERLMITLRELCEHTGVTRRTIQCYEVKGLMKAADKNKMGHLLYHDDAIEEVNLIRFYQSIGFTLKEIKEFETMDDGKFKELMHSKIATLEAEKILIGDKIRKINSIMED